MNASIDNTGRSGLTRREAVQAGLLVPCLALPALRASAAPPRKATAKSVIQIWLWGGPAHTDTFDPKPEAGSDYTGPFERPIPTNVDGIRVGELMVEMAKIADKYAVIRSMTHGNNAHETAAYIVQTGRMPGDGQVWPGVGAVTSLFRGSSAGYKGLIPPYVVLTQLQGRFSEVGFLGYKAKPFATGGNPAQPRFVVEGVVAEGISDERQRDRRDLMHRLDTFGAAMKQDPQLAALAETETQAYDMILGEGRKVFDLSQEKDDLRTRYGRTTFGQSCLIARRLVEQGVPYITINYQGWDTHKQHFQAMRRLLPEMDRGVATLIRDLSDRGLLDSTIIWWGGEFGRTPRVQWEPPWNGGRGHAGSVFTSVVAGGGFKGGRVVGASDARGEEVKDRPVYPWDLIRSMYMLMGIDPDGSLPHPRGLDVRVCPTPGPNVKSGGPLLEIM
jgi:uncharacterized protein (DUF1501 family)